jgi:hypothetical protein
MSLCSLTTRKLDIPHEKGEWIEVRPLSAKRLHAITIEAKRAANEAAQVDSIDTDAEGFALSSMLLREAVVSWSYDAPVDSETVDDLDIVTTTWLVGAINGVTDVPLSSTPDSSESSEETPQTE